MNSEGYTPLSIVHWERTARDTLAVCPLLDEGKNSEGYTVTCSCSYIQCLCVVHIFLTITLYSVST